MTTQATSISGAEAAPRGARSMTALLLGAPAVAIAAGLLAQWADFQALRVPLLVMVGCGVLATGYAVTDGRRDRRAFVTSVLIGIGTWAAAESIYSVLHIALGDRFHADRFGPQWAQALGLITAHGLLLGAPTGVAAGLLLRLPFVRRDR